MLEGSKQIIDVGRRLRLTQPAIASQSEIALAYGGDFREPLAVNGVEQSERCSLLQAQYVEKIVRLLVLQRYGLARGKRRRNV
jgi:hypothetical protein